MNNTSLASKTIINYNIHAITAVVREGGQCLDDSKSSNQMQ